MHPLYINDLITQLQQTIAEQALLLRTSVNELKTTQDRYKAAELEWFMMQVETNNKLLHHSLFQLYKHVEKLDAN